MLIQLSRVSSPNMVMLNQLLDSGMSTFTTTLKTLLTILVVVPIRAFNKGMTLENKGLAAGRKAGEEPGF